MSSDKSNSRYTTTARASETNEAPSYRTGSVPRRVGGLDQTKLLVFAHTGLVATRQANRWATYFKSVHSYDTHKSCPLGPPVVLDVPMGVG